MHRSQLIPLKLNRAQRAYMANAAGCARFAYNWALAEWKRQVITWWDSGRTSKYPNAFDLQKQFTAIKAAQFPWFADVAAEIHEKAIFSVGTAFGEYKAGRSRYPHFKSRATSRSFVAAGSGRAIRLSGKTVRLPKVGWLRLAVAFRWPAARLCSAVVTERAGRWYMAINCELPDAAPMQRPNAFAGVDLGIKTPLVVSSGETVASFGEGLAQRLNVERRKLRRANQRLHRRINGSRRRRVAALKVARIHQRMARIRSDVQHRATAQIASMASCVGVEALAVRNLLRNGRLARAIADVGFYEIKRQLKYKAEEVVEADRFYPSSKTCSSCGSIKQSLKLSDRVFRCEHCGHEQDRDENAARNLEHMAANRAVTVRGAGSPARQRKLTLSSLALKREAARSGAMKPNEEGSTS